MSRRRKKNDDYYEDDDRGYGDSGYDDGYDGGYDSGYDDYPDDGYEYDESGEIILEDEYGISLKSKKKAGRYRIISVLFLLLVIACSAGAFMYKQQLVQLNRDKCWNYQSLIESKIGQYVRENGLSANPAYIEDVPGISGIKFSCPDGGEFTWDPVNGTYKCSEHGHYPDWFVTPESVVTGTDVVAVSDDE